MQEYIRNLEEWFLENKRVLPWRNDKNPYHVWISEVMLQQTRIEAVISYYERFMRTLPDISSLAKVEDDQLLKLWEGLGYYNRARNLKKAAVMIMDEYRGEFPNTYSEIIKLPGIGEYTASAISSICFGERQVTVDGNVMRVFTRFYNDFSNISKDSTRKMIHDRLLSFPFLSPGNFNEGLMELGEVICLPNGIPKCDICPLRGGCLSYKNNNYFMFPVKDEKKVKEEIELTVIVPIWEKKTYVRKRKSPGLLHNLYEFYNVVGNKSADEVCELSKEFGRVKSIKRSICYTHVFSHKKWKMQSYFVFLESVICQDMFFSVSDIEDNFALPTAFSPFFYQFKEELK